MIEIDAEHDLLAHAAEETISAVADRLLQPRVA
jgi:hypothetical protein